MARLPSVETLPRPRGPQPVVRPPAFDAGAGLESAARFAESGAQISAEEAQRFEREAEIQDKYDLANARSLFLQGKVALDTEEPDDSNYAGFAGAYKTQIEAVRDKVAATLSGRTRESFLASANLDVARGYALAQGKAQKTEIDVGRATVNSLADANMKAILNAPDEATRAALMRATNDAIATAQGKNYLSAQEAEKARRGFAESYAKGRVSTMVPAAQVNALSQGMTVNKDGSRTFAPTNSYIDFLPPDVRSELLDTAKTQSYLDQERADRIADRQRKRAQEDAASTLAVRIMQGEAKAADLTTALASRTIGREQFNSLLGALRTEEQGVDDPNVEIDLRTDIINGNAAQSDILRARSSGALTPETTAELLTLHDQVARRGGPLASDAAKRALQYVDDTVGGVRGPFAILDFDSSTRVANAKREYTQRVLAEEDPWAVADDIVRRYRPQPPALTSFPRPQFLTGRIDDIAALAAAEAATVRAYEAQRIDKSTASRELRNIRAMIEAVQQRQINRDTGSRATDRVKGN